MTNPIKPELDQLLEKLKGKIEDPAQQQLLAHLAADVTRVMAQSLVDPAGADREITHLRASLSNIAAKEAQFVQVEMVRFLTNLALSVVSAALQR